ncbi:TonB-dependent receptor [Massilia cavernae]|uniref:TonB-dependent receptor n=1 Tax=Massilia cavernae TaxID=2320864 RepID=A0A418Y6Y7_9BURK|nr:TonB-dependent receptor [Massilia cavernae]RJG24135.1 TonB-dependent receptor [Massilia cavernae]
MKTITTPPGQLRPTSIALAAAMLAMGACAVPALAQQGAAPAKTVEEGLQTVVVTAQKRAQPMQKVPVAVNMVDAKAIENQQIVDFSDLTRVAPSMTLNQNPGNNTISLRGIGTFAFSIGIESAVSVIVDEVPVVQQMQAFSNLSDIERIEVLRGPQGTLFGKNSSAGVINVVTKESSDTLSGHVQVTATTDDERKVEASVSGPVSDAVGFRVNAYKVKRDGEITNLTTGEDLNGESAKGVRARIDFKPTANLRGKVIADYGTRRVGGPVQTLRAAPAGARLFGQPIAPALAGVTAGPENRNARMDTAGFTDSKNTSFSGTLNYQLDNHTLTSVTTWQDWKYNYLADFDGSEIPLLAIFSGGAVQGGFPMNGPYHSTMLTQELRIASNGDGALNYLGGLYYSDSDSERAFTRSRAGFPVAAKWDANTGNRTVAAFTQGEYKLTDATRVSAGFRYNREKINVGFTNLIPAVPARFAGASSDDVVTGKVALQHDLAKAVMVYASFATGYKGAGYDVSSGFDQSRIDRPVAPETSKAYEIGVKSRFLQNRVQLNATAFLTDYKDFQAQSSVVDPSTQLLQNAVNNVGELRTKGIELELTARPVNSLVLESSLALVDAKITSYRNAGCYLGQTLAQGCIPLGNGFVQDLSGKRLSNAPEVKATLGATYNFPLGESGYSGVANLNYQYQSEVNFDLKVNPLQVQEGYGIVNGSIALSTPMHALKVTLFVNNLFDKSYATFINDTADLHGGAHVLTQLLPRNSQRYVGLRVKYEF